MRPQWHGGESGEIFYEIFGVLDGEEVVVAAFGVHPVAGRDHHVRSQGGDDVAHHLLFAQPQFAGAEPVNVQLQRRVIHVLRHQHVAHPRQGARLPGDFDGRLMFLLQIHAADLDVQRRRQPKIENRVHQAAGLKIGVHLRQFLFQASAHQVHVLKAAQPVAVVQTHLDKRRVRPRVGRVDRGKTRRHPDVGDDDLQVLCRHHFPHHLLHLLHQLVVSSIRVPVGALRLMTNWPGSVRGK